MSTSTFALNDGNHIPWIAYGTGTALYGKDAATSVKMAINGSMPSIDGAQMYNNEESIGAAIKETGKARNELYVTTKLRTLSDGETVEQSLRTSLSKLGLDYVDLFLIHDPTKHSLKETWSSMEKLQEQGLAKSIGVSNFTVDHLKQVLDGASIVPAVNQIEYHPYVAAQAAPILDFCKSKNIVIESYGGQTPIFRATGGPLDPVLENIRSRVEKAHGSPVTAGQVLGLWLHQKGIVIVMTTSKEDRLKEYLDIIKLPKLSPEEIESIDKEGAKLHNRVFMSHAYN